MKAEAVIFQNIATWCSWDPKTVGDLPFTIHASVPWWDRKTGGHRWPCLFPLKSEAPKCQSYLSKTYISSQNNFNTHNQEILTGFWSKNNICVLVKIKVNRSFVHKCLWYYIRYVPGCIYHTDDDRARQKFTMLQTKSVCRYLIFISREKWWVTSELWNETGKDKSLKRLKTP